MFVQRVKEKEAELKEAEKEVNVSLESRQVEERLSAGRGVEGLVASGQDCSAAPVERLGGHLCLLDLHSLRPGQFLILFIV